MHELTVTLASHHFKVSGVSVRARGAVEQFAKPLIHRLDWNRPNSRYQKKPVEKSKDKVYAAATKDRSEYRFHINQLDLFREHLKLHYVNDSMVNYVVLPFVEPRRVAIKMQPQWKVKPHQEGSVDYCLADEPVRKMLSMGTGRGKSFVSMWTAAMLGVLTCFVLRAGYFEKWLHDFRRTYELGPEDLMVVRGSEDLQALLHMGMRGEMPSKIIVVSKTTLQNWIKLYEKLGAGILAIGYPCMPDEFFQLLRVGFKVIDEVHEEFHLNFRMDLYTHVQRSLAMSATLKGDDGFVNKMYQLAYPMADRFEGPTAEKFVSATAITYRLNQPERIKQVDPRKGTYSHHYFELQLLKDKKLSENYVNMIMNVVHTELFLDHKPGERMLVYVAGVEFATMLTDRLRGKYPDEMINRYCGSMNDSYDDLLNSTVSVSTLGSAGTNIDIANLKCVFLTTAVRSSQRNIQGFGRLRDNLMEGRRSRFVSAVCQDMSKHTEYHRERWDILKDRALTLNSQNYPYPL